MIFEATKVTDGRAKRLGTREAGVHSLTNVMISRVTRYNRVSNNNSLLILMSRVTYFMEIIVENCLDAYNT